MVKVIACIFMMAFATVAAWCISYSPNRLVIGSQFLDSSLVFEAGDVARESFVSRLAGFQVLNHTRLHSFKGVQADPKLTATPIRVSACHDQL